MTRRIMPIAVHAVGPVAGETGVVLQGTAEVRDLGLKKDHYYELVDARATLLDQTVERALGLVWASASLLDGGATGPAAEARGYQVDLLGGTLGSRLPLVAGTPIPLRDDLDKRIVMYVRHADNIANGPLAVLFTFRIVEREPTDVW
jgi:hypothetical protein